MFDLPWTIHCGSYAAMKELIENDSIQRFLSTTGIKIQSRFSDFLVYNWTCKEDYNCIENTPYRNHYFEITLEESFHTVRIDQFDFQGGADRIFFVSPFRLQTCVADGTEEIRGWTILFQPEFIHLSASEKLYIHNFAFFDRQNNPSITLSPDQKKEFVSLFQKIQEEYLNQDNVYSREIIKHLLLVMLLKGKQYYENDHQPLRNIKREEQIYNEFMELVQRNFIQWHTVKEYAGQLNISAKHLSETVKQISGKNALQIIQHTRIHHAKAMLRQTTMSVSQIASELQFETSHHFSFFFKKHTGQSPKQFRNS
jgi:AraC family transcriptional regulator, transcriptional activator of pobA